MVGQLKGTWLLNYHVKKGNMMVVMMDLDQNLFPSQQAQLVFLCISVNDYYYVIQ